MDVLEQLVSLLALEKLEENLFRGQSQDLGWGRVFGGQVLGQALSAAVQTVPAERHVHSLNAYFLRPGDVKRPILYQVDCIRDGGSFTTRRIVAVQNGAAIFNMAASFQVEEQGFEHQDEMPPAPAPETLAEESERYKAYIESLPPKRRDELMAVWPIELKPVEVEDDSMHPSKEPPRRMVWLKARGQLPATPSLHAYLLAYASDFSFMTTSLKPHGVTWLTPKIQLASLDHVMWFHRPLRIDDWLLHVMDSPSATSARGLVRGQVFDRAGRLVASTAQEGLIRRAP